MTYGCQMYSSGTRGNETYICGPLWLKGSRVQREHLSLITMFEASFSETLSWAWLYSGLILRSPQTMFFYQLLLAYSFSPVRCNLLFYNHKKYCQRHPSCPNILRFLGNNAAKVRLSLFIKANGLVCRCFACRCSASFILLRLLLVTRNSGHC